MPQVFREIKSSDTICEAEEVLNLQMKNLFLMFQVVVTTCWATSNWESVSNEFYTSLELCSLRGDLIVGGCTLIEHQEGFADALFSQMILREDQHYSEDSILYHIPYKLEYKKQLGERDYLIVDSNHNIPLQIVQFCVDEVIQIDTCALIHNTLYALNVLTDKNGLSFVEYTLNYYNKWIANKNPTGLTTNKLEDLKPLSNGDDCYKGWREGNTMLTNESFRMYVVNHDNDSAQLMHEQVFDGKESNGVLIPIRVRSTVFFEYAIYVEVLPYLYNEWSNLDYVGISTYKTVMTCPELCTNEVYRLLQVARLHDYDVVPFLTGNDYGLLINAVINHGRAFRNAWDAVLLALGYDIETIREHYTVRAFYRNSMLIKPIWLKKLSLFMGRAISTVLYNTTLYELCSKDGKYVGNFEVSQRIFGTNSYQLFPFLFERLPSFFLAVEGAKIYWK